jgi:hypothetical protein
MARRVTFSTLKHKHLSVENSDLFAAIWFLAGVPTYTQLTALIPPELEAPTSR